MATEPFDHYNALTSLLAMIDYAEAVEQRSNEELAQILIDQVWAELPLDSAASAFVGEVACRLAPSLFESADLEREWPQMPDLEGVDIFPHLPISGHTERRNDD